MGVNEVHHRKSFPCPWCKVDIDFSFGVGTIGKPKGGDPCICIECGQVNVFVGINSLRRPTYDEFQEFLKDPTILNGLAFWRMFDLLWKAAGNR